MAAIIRRLRTKPDRLRQDDAERLRDALLPFESEFPEQVRDLFGVIDRRTASRNRWTFVMLSPSQNAAVVRHLRRSSSRPMVAMELWAMCFEHLRGDTGEILLTRDQIADSLGQHAQNISQIMSELEACGAIIRKRAKVAGMRGPGVTRYFMNPNVATHLAGAERDLAQSKAPPLLTIMQGGKP